MFTADPQTIADLLPPPALDDVKAFLLAYLSVPQNQITDWESGAVLRTIWELESLIIQDFAGPSLGAMVANGYPDVSTGESQTQLAHGWFGIERALPAVATQNVTLACDSTHGPYTAAQVNALIGISSDGAVYHITTGGSLATGGTVAVVFTAETPGGARGLISGFANPIGGVTVASAAIATFGSNGDNDTTVAAAMDARFPDLSVLPTEDRVITWAKAAAPAPLITRFRLDADPAIPGGVLVTLANAGGPVLSGTVTTVQAAYDLLSAITDLNTAQNSTAHTINASGTVTVKKALLARAQAQADAAWVAAHATAQIGATFYLETLRKIVGDAIKLDPGSNFTGAALSGAGGDGNVALSATEVPVPGGTLTSQLTWVAT